MVLKWRKEEEEEEEEEEDEGGVGGVGGVGLGVGRLVCHQEGREKEEELESFPEL